jgi:hypothetical protein
MKVRVKTYLDERPLILYLRGELPWYALLLPTLLSLLTKCCCGNMVLDNHTRGSTSSSLYVDAAGDAETLLGKSAGGRVDVRRIVLRKVSGLSSLLIIKAMMLDNIVCKGVRTDIDC